MCFWLIFSWKVRSISGTLSPSNPINVSKGIKWASPHLGALHAVPTIRLDAEIVRIASKSQGVKRNTGQHPGGIIVIPNNENVLNFTPYIFPAEERTQDWFTTH